MIDCALVLPKEGLQLVNVRESYKDGDFVNIQCRSSASKPSMVLRWHINGQQVRNVVDQ